MRITRRHWTVALVTASLLHAGIAGLLLWQKPETGAEDIGIGGIEVSLGPAGGMPEQPPPAQEETPEPDSVPEPEPEPEPELEPEPEPEPDPQPTPPRPRAESPRTATSQAPTSSPSATAAPAGESHAQDNETRGSTPGPSADYMTHLKAWLERHKRYPRGAQMRRQEGTALLHFVMDREGRILEYRLQESSGHATLDREVEAMLKRAEPLPTFPEEMQASQLELVVPVTFYLR